MALGNGAQCSLAETSWRHCAHEAQPSFSGPLSPISPPLPAFGKKKRDGAQVPRKHYQEKGRTVAAVGKLTERSCYLEKMVLSDGWQDGTYTKTADD